MLLAEDVVQLEAHIINVQNRLTGADSQGIAQEGIELWIGDVVFQNI